MENRYADNTVDELRAFYANALVTASGCGGHGKMHWNNVVASQLRREIQARGIAVPSDKEAYAVGRFNGPGSC